MPTFTQPTYLDVSDSYHNSIETNNGVYQPEFNEEFWQDLVNDPLDIQVLDSIHQIEL